METFSEYLRAAARLLHKRASEASPAPWERPLDTRTKASVIAHLPEGERPQSWQGGIVPEEFGQYSGPLGRYAGQREPVTIVTAPHFEGGGPFMRPRSGRDLEYIALIDPEVGIMLSQWLDYQANLADSMRYAEGAPGDNYAAGIAEKILGREQDK